MTTKISWNQYNTIPNDLFWWRGIDGSEILTYFISTPLDGEDMRNRFATYNGLLTPHSVIGSWKKFKNKDISRDTLIAYGYGDGGGGVNRDMLKMAHAMQDVPGLPEVRLTSARDFFDRVHQLVETTESYVPIWDGELYLEYHRGTYTSQGANKKNNRLYENRLARSEWLATAAMLCGVDYDTETIETCWKTVLRNQFHDIIPGSSIREVYEDSGKEYAQVGEMLDALDARSIQTFLTADKEACTLLNDASFGGLRMALLPGDDRVTGYCDETGSPLAAQKTQKGWMVETAMAALSAKTVVPMHEAMETAAVPFCVDLAARTVETPFYHVAWDKNGVLTRLTDKENQREVLAGCGNMLRIFEDRPANFDAWDIDLFYTQKAPESPTLTSCTLQEIGPLCCVLRFAYTYHHSTFCQDVTLYAHNRRVDFATTVDWHEEHRLLKSAFQVDVRSTKATFDIQCGHVERPTHYNTSWDYARFEVCAHKWMDLSDDSYGVSLLNDCKYGCNVFGNELQITLLKSAKEPDYAADMGEHRFTYALLPHSGTVTQGYTIPESHFLNHPVAVITDAVTPLPTVHFDGNIVVDAVKKAYDSDDVVVRFHEYRGGRTKARLSLDAPISGWTLCNMLEENSGRRMDTDCVDVTLRPFEIVTVKLHRAV